jgi:hypothetical protein
VVNANPNATNQKEEETQRRNTILRKEDLVKRKITRKEDLENVNKAKL